MISTPLCLNRISVFLKKLFSCRYLVSHPSGMCIPHISQQSSGSLTSCNTTNLDYKCQYMKLSRSLLALWDTDGPPGTRQSIFFNNLGNNTTYVVDPSPPMSTYLVYGNLLAWYRSMWCLKEEAATEAPHSVQLTLFPPPPPGMSPPPLPSSIYTPLYLFFPI